MRLISSPTLAWAYGLDREQRVVLLRSADSGITWTDESKSLIQASAIDVFPASMAVAGSQLWMVARNAHGFGPYIATSADGGATWSPFAATDLRRATAAMLTVTAGNDTLARVDEHGTHLERVDGATQAATPPAHVDGLQAAAAIVSDSRAWLAGSISAGIAIRPALWSVDSLGNTEQKTLVHGGSAVLSAVDVRGEIGIAGGMRLDDSSGALLFHGAVDSGTWEVAMIAQSPDRMVVRGIALTEGGDAWAVGHGHGTSESAFLFSADKGATWQRIAGPVDIGSTLFAIAAAPQG